MLQKIVLSSSIFRARMRKFGMDILLNIRNNPLLVVGLLVLDQFCEYPSIGYSSYLCTYKNLLMYLVETLSNEKAHFFDVGKTYCESRAK